MKSTGLKFLLDYGSFVSIVVLESEARTIIRRWLSGDLQGIIGDDKGWAVKISSIMAIHTFDIQTSQQGSLMIPPGGLRPGSSGLNN